jgi:RHS repeat-associated protein
VAAVCPAASTTLSDAYRYDGFGQQIANAGTITNPWRYRGLLNLTADYGAGALLSMAARDYAPQLGVFTQEDSVAGSAANPLTMNRFLYALANPATLVDPDGHMAEAGGGGGSLSNICTDPSCWSGVTAAPSPTKVVGTAATCGACVTTPEPPVEPSGIPSSAWPFGGFCQQYGAVLGAATCYGPGDAPLGNACAYSTGADIDGGCDSVNPLETADALATWVLAGADGAKDSREWVSKLARCLRLCTDATALSAAGRLLKSASNLTAFGRLPWFKGVVRWLPGIGLVTEFGFKLAEGKGFGEAGTRAVVKTAGEALAGNAAFGAVCGAGAAISAVVAIGICFGAVTVSSWLAGEAVDKAFDVILGP